MAFKTPTDLASTTLASGYTTGATTMSLNDGARFDTGGGYVIIIKNNIIWQYSYTSRSSNTLNGLSFMISSDGSADQNHAAGTSIKVGIARDYFKQILDKFDSNERLKHEWGGVEADISAIQDGQILIGTGSGTLGLESGATARTSLGLAIGTNVQAWDAQLDSLAALSSVANLENIAGLATTDNGIIIGNGTQFVLETGATARTSLGIGTTDVPQFQGVLLSGQQNAIQINPFGTSTGNTGEFRFLELAANGTNYIGLKAPNSIAANVIWTLPAADGTVAGQSLQTNAAGVLSWGTTLNNLVEDTTPELGGMLDVNGFAIGDGASELLKFIETSGAVNEITISNNTTGNPPSIAATGDDANISLRLNAKGSGNLILHNISTGSVGIGTAAPSAYLDIEKQGAAKANSIFLELTNTGNAVDMDGTISSIRFNQNYYDASTPAADESGQISVGTETDWTSTSSTRNSFLSFYISTSGALTERARITSAGRLGIRTTAPASTLHVAPDAAGAIQIDPFGASAGDTGQLRFLELAANGTNYVGFKAPDGIASNLIWTLPAVDGAASQVISTNGSGVLSWSTAGELVNDTSPQLGGQLDVNGFALGDGTNELLKFVEAASAVNEISIGNAATGSAPTLSATGDDANISLRFNAKGTGDLILQNTATGSVGIGTTTPSAYLDIQRSGNLKANTSFLEITNSQNAADMDGTETSIHFNQFYYDASSPAPQDSGRITVGTETDWTSTTSSRDSYLAFHTTSNASLTERLRITSDGRLGIRTTSPTSTLHIKPDSAGALQIDPYGTGGGQTGELRLLELAANGTNYVGFKAPDALAGSIVWALPTADGSSGQFLRTDGAGILSWAGSSGGTGITAVQDDTTPTLGGNLNTNGFAIAASLGREYIKFTAVGSAVNEINITHAATANKPIISASGDDINVGLIIDTKGTGDLFLLSSGTGSIRLGGNLNLNGKFLMDTNAN